MKNVMSWIRLFGVVELFLILTITAYSFVSGVREVLLGLLVLTLILLRLEVIYLKSTHGILSIVSYFSVWYYIFHYSGLSFDPESAEARTFFVLAPIIFLIVIFNFQPIRSSLITVLLLTAFFGTYGHEFWRLIGEPSSRLAIERKAVDESHKPCRNVNHPYLGYQRLENCESHKIDYWFDGQILTTFQITTDARGDRFVPSSNPKSDDVAIFIGGSRTFGDGVSNH